MWFAFAADWPAIKALRILYVHLPTLLRPVYVVVFVSFLCIWKKKNNHWKRAFGICHNFLTIEFCAYGMGKWNYVHSNGWNGIEPPPLAMCAKVLTHSYYVYLCRLHCNMKSTENICMHFSKAFLAGLAVAFVVCVTFAERNEDAANGGYYAWTWKNVIHLNYIDIGTRHHFMQNANVLVMQSDSMRRSWVRSLTQAGWRRCSRQKAQPKFHNAE